MKPCLIFGIFLLSLSVVKADTRFVIQSGHNAPVISVNWQQTQGLLVSWGQDYKLKIWHALQQKLIYDIYLPNVYGNFLAIHPQLTQLAYLTQQNNGYELWVYDWLKNKLLFKYSLSAKPLTLTYSPHGNWLAFSLENWRSLYLLDSQTGEEKYIMPAFGLVTFVGFSPRESSLFAYQPSGKISYWELKPKPVLKAELKTISALTPLMLSLDRCFFLAQKANSLYVIDAVNGVQKHSLSYLGNYLVSTSTYSQSFSCLIQNPGVGVSLEFFNIDNGIAKKVKELKIDNFEKNISVLYYNHGLCFLGLNDGSIYKLNNDNLEPVLKNNTSKIRQAAMHNGSLVTALPEAIIVFKDIFNYLTESSQALETKLELHWLKIRSSAYFRVSTSPNLGFMLWEDKSPSGLIYRLDLNDSLILEKIPVSPLGIKNIFTSPYGFLVLNHNNLLRLLDEKTFKPKGELVLPNIKGAIAISSSEVILSQESYSILDNPLLYWQTQTTKPIPLPEDYRSIEGLAFNAKTSVLAYIALTEKDGTYLRTLKIRNLNDYKSANELISHSKPTGKAFLISDLLNNNLYFTFGQGDLNCYDGNKIYQFQTAPSPLLSLDQSANFIYGLSNDSALIIWDKETGHISYQFYLFPNYSWFVISAANTVFYGGELVDKVSFAEDVKMLEISFVNREQDWP